ncbi:unnamed protein product, partial [Discosporangium mesarthrocarpum]
MTAKENQTSVNTLLASGKAAVDAGDRGAAAKHLSEATKISPESAKAWRALVNLHEDGDDKAALAAALKRCVEIAEAKGNFDRSRPIRLRLAEVQSALGDKKAALGTLKAFTSNPAAVAAPGDNRDKENSTMKQLSTQLFMEINAGVIPGPVPAPAKVWASPKVAAAAAAAAESQKQAASASTAQCPASVALGLRQEDLMHLSGWVKVAAGHQPRTR